jgi:anaerobic carbon-monoxide dehydrogenase iron sulfur subunit
LIIHVDPAACTGCRACEIFCPIAQEGIANPALARIRVLKDEAHNIFLPIVCPPCQDKACVAACPESGAIVVVPETGAVVIVDDHCTGCSKCVGACDIGAIRLVRQAGRGKFGKAVAVKCNQCGGDPWCVKACAPGALRYMDETAEQNGQIVFEILRTALAEAEPVMFARGAKPRRRIGSR